MLKNLLIGISVVCVCALLFVFRGETLNSVDIQSYTLNKAYLAKNTEEYARCYNSVNHSSTLLGDIELSLIGEYPGSSRVTPESLKAVREEFLNTIKQKCNDAINKYEVAYKDVDAIRKKSESLKVGWSTFIFGGGDQTISVGDISEYYPSRARMMIPFNEYIFTKEEVAKFYLNRLEI